ncbi:DUF5677 domain-containing protein [Desulfolutivibrio sulfoxidireducens]|uniref:DUF5677 domain-containing protein n=1 Tax=Desulfolutivibrio sulfoxidireducens TaxID=2773299 RepID=UPI00159E580F|nr:DUF5677 domain-containing protein [Desulfolutivibrio sulfoxidireducens]QLA19639.1 hypothetical protein GD604_07765 [Desulfolutivibrio sulfoxidireducens]
MPDKNNLTINSAIQSYKTAIGYILKDCTFDITSEHIKIDKYLLILFTRIITLSDAILNNISNSIYCAIQPLLRILIEAHIQFINLTKDINKTKQIDYEACNRTLQLLISLEEIDEYAEYIDQDKHNAKKSELKKLLEDLKKYKSNIEKKFDTIGLTPLYSALYRPLSLHVHNNLRALESLHLVTKDNSSVIVPFKSLHIDEMMSYIFTALKIMTSDAIILNLYFDSRLFPSLPEALSEFEKFQQFYFNKFPPSKDIP